MILYDDTSSHKTLLGKPFFEEEGGDHCFAAPTILAWFDPKWHFHVPETKNLCKSISCCITSRHSQYCDDSCERKFGKQLPVMFLSVEKMLEYI